MALKNYHITVSARDFARFIQSINGVYRHGVTITIHKEYMEALVLSEDNASIFLYAKLNTLETNLDESEQVVINVRDLSKFLTLIQFNKDETFTFTVKDNYIYYIGKSIAGAKFILDENPSRKINKRITVDWFNQFESHFTIKVTPQDIKQVIQLASLASDSNKVYIYERDNAVIAELNDKEKVNIDSLEVTLGTSYEGHINGQVIISLDTLRCLLNALNDIELQVKSIHGHEALVFTMGNSNLLLKYLFTSMIR